MLQFWLHFFWLSLPLYALATILEIIFRLKPPCQGVATREGEAQRSPQQSPKPFLRRSGLAVGWLAFASHTTFLVLRTILAAQAPLSGLFASLNFFIWCLGLFYFSYALRQKLRAIGIIILPLILGLLFMSMNAPKEITPLLPALRTIWFEIHVSSAFLSYALFGVGGAAALLALLASEGSQNILPSGELVDDFTYRALAWGFLIFSFSMVSGGVWAYLAWSDYWVWTPKELWSIVIWVYYSTYFHARVTRGWQGRRSQVLAVIGFIIVLFTYLGVGLLMKSSHPL